MSAPAAVADNSPHQALNSDDELLRDVAELIVARFGVDGLARFLRLLGGRPETFAELRESWLTRSHDELIAEVGRVSS